jgi:hypothetical protein
MEQFRRLECCLRSNQQSDGQQQGSWYHWCDCTLFVEHGMSSDYDGYELFVKPYIAHATRYF